MLPGAYDKEKVYKALKYLPNQEVPIQPIIPPRRNAKIGQHGNCKDPPLPRDENLRLPAAGRQDSKDGTEGVETTKWISSPINC